MTDTPRPEREPQPDEADSMEGSSYGASSAESGGNYDQAGPTMANTEGEPMDAEETTSDEPSPS